MQRSRSIIASSCRPMGNGKRGTAIVSALLILMLLTFVALTATNTTVDEKKMVRSEAVFEENFNLAESAGFESAQLLQNSPRDCALVALAGATCPTYKQMKASNKENEEDYVLNIDANDDDNIDLSDFPTEGLSSVDATNHTSRLIVEKKISGSSLGLDTSRMYSWNTYGFSDKYNGRTLIVLGFKKRM